MRTKKLVALVTMTIRDTVKIEGGHWCMILVDKCQNHHNMTENAGS